MDVDTLQWIMLGLLLIMITLLGIVAVIDSYVHKRINATLKEMTNKINELEYHD